MFPGVTKALAKVEANTNFSYLKMLEKTQDIIKLATSFSHFCLITCKRLATSCINYIFLKH